MTHLRSLAFILLVACVHAVVFLWCLHAYLDAYREVYNGVSVGLGRFSIAPVFHVAWLVLSMPFGLLRLLMPRTYTLHALRLTTVIPDALLWGWCVHRLHGLVRRHRQPHPAPDYSLERTGEEGRVRP